MRLLLGFGILNLVNVAFAFASALEIMVAVSPKLTLACLVPLPLVTLLSRRISRGLYVRMRESQAALGRLTDVLQANLAGIRVVRSFALEESERRRFDSDQQGVPAREPRTRSAARIAWANDWSGSRGRDPRVLLVWGVAPPQWAVKWGSPPARSSRFGVHSRAWCGR